MVSNAKLTTGPTQSVVIINSFFISVLWKTSWCPSQVLVCWFLSCLCALLSSAVHLFLLLLFQPPSLLLLLFAVLFSRSAKLRSDNSCRVTPRAKTDQNNSPPPLLLCSPLLAPSSPHFNRLPVQPPPHPHRCSFWEFAGCAHEERACVALARGDLMLFSCTLLERKDERERSRGVIYRRLHVAGAGVWYTDRGRDLLHTSCTYFRLTSDSDTCVTRIVSKVCEEGVMQGFAALALPLLPVLGKSSWVRQDAGTTAHCSQSFNQSVSQPVRL